MKQRTVWHGESRMSKGNFTQVGVIHKNKQTVKEDIIRIRCLSSKPGFGWDVHMRVDEAMTLVAGLSKTLIRLMYCDEKSFIKSAKLK